MGTLVIRFLNVGDIVSAGSVTRALASATFLTLERCAELAALLPGATEVRTLEHCAQSAVDGMTKIIDLHDGPRSRWATVIRSRAVALGGDTGLMHLAAAAGLRTLPLVGPNHCQTAFWLNHTTPIEEDLECQPCSRHGGDVYPIGDHLCMTRMSTDTAWKPLVQDHHA